MKNPILIRKVVELKIVLVLTMSFAQCIFSHVSADCAFSICEWVMSEDDTNIYHFCYMLQPNFMFYYINVSFLIYIFTVCYQV